ncbi:MAG: phosphoribosylaminoimidazolesuccinocarboxamide synthase [Verrucomicrobia bacterium]|nr:phosphoribosylaminoimidazolesuccinocarboxamide synthase [Verrucomicrobiota bacterium]
MFAPVEILTLDLPGIPKVRSGKVREVFDLGGYGILFVATDRLSAFDVILPDPIPHKGRVLNALSIFWFRHLRGALPALGLGDHFVTEDFDLFPDMLQPFARELAGRAMLVRRAVPLPVECVVRGYLAGSGWKEYRERGSVCGHRLPAGLRLGDRLPAPIFTPATKAEGGAHDENIDFDGCVRHLGGDAALATRLRDASLAIYRAGAEYAAARGILIADTKFEFGTDAASGELLLIDECLTPDSSRFWPAAEYAPGTSPPSFDKQFVRDYLETLDWNKTPPAPKLPPEIIARTSEKYLQAYQKITGRTLPDGAGKF